MSIKEELERLREEQYQLEKKIKEEEYKKKCGNQEFARNAGEFKQIQR